MYGQITKFHSRIGAGVIRTDDGRKYRFAGSEIMNGRKEMIGLGVDFLLAGRRPHKIIVLAGSPWTAFGEIRRS